MAILLIKISEKIILKFDLLIQMQSVVQPALLLQNETDNVYAFGIGSGIDETELEAIATDKRKTHGWGVMASFSQYESFILDFIGRSEGCKTLKIQPYRNDIQLYRCNFM